MKSTKSEGRRFEFGPSDKILLGIAAVLLVAVIALNIMERCGLSLINGVMMLHLPVLLVIVLLGWGVYALVRRIKRSGVKIVVGGVLALVLVLVLMLSTTYINYIAPYSGIPQRFGTVQPASGGRRLVVFWRFDQEDSHTEERRLARMEEYPDDDPKTNATDVCVAFDAYPEVLGWFYRSNADVEGKVFLSYLGGAVALDEEALAEAQAKSSEQAENAEQVGEEGQSEEAAKVEDIHLLPHGTLMVDWLDENQTAHFFVKDPGPGEGGECTVKF